MMRLVISRHRLIRWRKNRRGERPLVCKVESLEASNKEWPHPHCSLHRLELFLIVLLMRPPMSTGPVVLPNRGSLCGEVHWV